MTARVHERFLEVQPLRGESAVDQSDSRAEEDGVELQNDLIHQPRREQRGRKLCATTEPDGLPRLTLENPDRIRRVALDQRNAWIRAFRHGRRKDVLVEGGVG